jgi:hypothetical protein
MDEEEAKRILDPHIRRLRKLQYSELVPYVKDVEAFQATGESGTIYNVEIMALWDSARRPATFVSWHALMTDTSGGAFFQSSALYARTSSSRRMARSSASSCNHRPG